MSFPFPIDKLTLINRALSQTGDNLIAVADDGSDEWTNTSPAYDAGLGYAMESHSWGYATQTIVLPPSPTPPQDTAWDTAYPIPEDCIHILWLKINDDTSDPLSQTTAQFTLYDIAGTPNGPVIVTNAQGGPPPPPAGTVAPSVIILKYISNSGALCDSTNGTPTLLLALQLYVESGIYQGLHEDVATAKEKRLEAKAMLQEARTVYDQQKPKRQFWNSRMGASRRIRRPWPPIGIGGWNGNGGPPG
jgi:hypothetical protein